MSILISTLVYANPVSKGYATSLYKISMKIGQPPIIQLAALVLTNKDITPKNTVPEDTKPTEDSPHEETKDNPTQTKNIHIGKVIETGITGRVDITVDVNDTQSSGASSGSKQKISIGTLENSTIRGKIKVQGQVNQIIQEQSGSSHAQNVRIGVLR